MSQDAGFRRLHRRTGSSFGCALSETDGLPNAERLWAPKIGLINKHDCSQASAQTLAGSALGSLSTRKRWTADPLTTPRKRGEIFERGGNAHGRYPTWCGHRRAPPPCTVRCGRAGFPLTCGRQNHVGKSPTRSAPLCLALMRFPFQQPGKPWREAGSAGWKGGRSAPEAR